ncbi:hypothetical protein [Sphaerimonospora mesophila]|uniref:hypothetical protein n=1 Tax=Sphaerimonospora mesophila TaxID=37483 RepID=UPI0006E2F957
MLCESPDCSHRPATGFRLCAECREAVRGELRSLPGLHRECALRLVDVPDGIAQRVTWTRQPGLDLNEAVVEVRSDIIGVLSSWCGLVAQERGVAAPGPRSADVLAAFLDGHLAWLARHPAARDFAAEIRRLAEKARAAIERGSGRPRPLGPCDRPECGQIVYAARLSDGRRQVRCDGGHVWQPHEWLSLSLRIDQAAAGELRRERVA